VWLRMSGVAMADRPLVLALGEVLWDLLPGGRQLGGAPANFAYHAAQLGADARIVSAVGDDELGREILDRLRSQSLDTSYVAVDRDHPTGVVTVTLDLAGQPSYTIHEDVAWDYIPTNRGLLDLAAKAECICFGTLAQRSRTAREAIRAVLSRVGPNALKILDINFRQDYYDRELVDRSLRAASVLKINEQELEELPTLLGDPDAEIFDRYPGMELLAVTRGEGGSSLRSSDGTHVEHPGYPAVPMVDAVGAGDSFTAALAVGLLRGLPLARINDNANRLASFVCTQPGATPAIPVELLARMH
ncbi:MAG TPA: carbohydrate kinase, partial [Tepidisphaeraceae bacterium]